MSEQEEKKVDKEEKVEETTDPQKIIVDNLSPRQIIELDACTRCGECVEWCPVYNQDEREGVTPRSKATRFKKILSSQYGLFRSDSFLGKLFRKKKISQEALNQFATDLYECSTCRQCHFVCPSYIDTVELWEGIRRSFVDAGYGPLEQQKNLIQSVKSYDNPWGQPRSSRSRWAKGAKRKKRIAQEPRDITRHKAEVLYFVGCTGSYDVNVEAVAINTVNILNHAKIDYGILGNKEKCCGSVLLRMGDHESFAKIAEENIKQLNELGIKTLVTSCAGCFKTIKHDYEKVGNANFEIKHITEYLVDLIKAGKLELNNEVKMKVTYHDPCHMGRHSGVYDAPRELLKLIPGIEFVEMERSRELSRCCGAGGGLKAGFPDIQNQISQKRIADALATGATELVSACPFCYQGLQVGIQALNAKITIRDITEIINMAIAENTAHEESPHSEAISP
jgi:heterodisulfide reductase subunit D